MHHIHQAKQVLCSAEKMFQLVNNVDEYDQFIPYCTKSTILHQDKHSMKASISLGLMGLEYSFTTQNKLIYGQSITINLVSGTFHHLSGCWQFIPLGDNHCSVEADFEFSIKNTLLRRLINPMLERIIDELIASFEKRAKELS
jgi:ribosome-associated toxin RatA of RatAB toxin-antitoxin module